MFLAESDWPTHTSLFGYRNVTAAVRPVAATNGFAIPTHSQVVARARSISVGVKPARNQCQLVSIEAVSHTCLVVRLLGLVICQLVLLLSQLYNLHTLGLRRVTGICSLELLQTLLEALYALYEVVNDGALYGTKTRLTASYRTHWRSA